MTQPDTGERAGRRPGRLIVFEGIDGAGKSEQARRLRHRLAGRGFTCLMLREPTDGQYGSRLRELAAKGRETVSREEECELFRLDRQENVANNIAPALERGDVALLDRYYYSTMAYQGALGLDPEKIRRDHEAFAPPPDVALYFDLDPECAVERIRNGRGESPNLFEKLDYLRKVRAIYQSMRFPYWRVIDASRPPDAVEKDVWSAVEPIIAGLI